MVDSHDIDGHVVLGRSRDNDLLGSALQVQGSSLFLCESTGALSYIVGAFFSPRKLCGVSLAEESNLLTIDNESLIVGLQLSRESSYRKISSDMRNKNLK